uniref:Cystatin-A-like n=1 Tax=Sinocyclocheilus rhinocerous TaxID=307959 RepID=A0A673HNX0_9TELE
MTELGLGNWSPVTPVTLKVIKICIEVMQLIEEKVESKPDSKIYIPVVYSSQIVQGTNYVVKVNGDGVCFHAMIYQALPGDGGKPILTGIQFPKTFDDPLIPF